MKIYLDGKLVDKEKACISVFDHGLLYGDGVFEGIRTYDGLIFRLKEHIDRLYKSADAIELKIPLNKMEMIEAVIKTLKGNKLKEAYYYKLNFTAPGAVVSKLEGGYKLNSDIMRVMVTKR